MWRKILLGIISSPLLLASFILDMIMLPVIILWIMFSGWFLLIEKLKKTCTWYDQKPFYDALHCCFDLTRDYFRVTWRK